MRWLPLLTTLAVIAVDCSRTGAEYSPEVKRLLVVAYDYGAPDAA